MSLDGSVRFGLAGWKNDRVQGLGSLGAGLGRLKRRQVRRLEQGIRQTSFWPKCCGLARAHRLSDQFSSVFPSSPDRSINIAQVN